jgi:hypothetical protein
MRLMNVHLLELKTFNHTNVPPYAVLSHTWGDDEVDYHTFISKPEVKSGRGWAKILRTCKQAIQDNYNWIWIDTCNIDKSSSAELSEAINSMFSWYQRSAVCYAFLEDVHTGDISQELEFHQLLRKARWFTRGWTLQELVAPRKIIFYSAAWEVLGTKNTLGPMLAEITRVNERVLRNSAMVATMSIAQIMSWAAHRQTTRVEDIGYCLLGIFNITMPLLYGEGSRAFRRLQEELINRFDDQTIFAWSLSASLTPDTGEPDDRALESLLGGGVLALHPLAFKDSGHISPKMQLDKAREPIAITTRGILIKAHLRRTKDPTRCDWLIPCSSTEYPNHVVSIPLRTPSSRTRRYSRTAVGMESIKYEHEVLMSEPSYKQIHLKTAVDYNPTPFSRICYLRSYPSYMLEPIEGLVVDLDKPDSVPLRKTYYQGDIQNGRLWDPESWTVDLGVPHIHNGVALLFNFVLAPVPSKYLAMSMTFPGPSLVMMTRHRAIDTTPLLDQILKANLYKFKKTQEWIYIPEIKSSISVQADLEVERGGIIYALDVHFEPIRGPTEYYIDWKEDCDAEE